MIGMLKLFLNLRIFGLIKTGVSYGWSLIIGSGHASNILRHGSRSTQLARGIVQC